MPMLKLMRSWCDAERAAVDCEIELARLDPARGRGCAEVAHRANYLRKAADGTFVALIEASRIASLRCQ
jgi:hypothetical protein